MRDQDIINKFANNLRAERNRLGLSQYQLGDLANIDGSYISVIERGEVNPTLTTIIPILDALGIPFSALYPTKVSDKSL